MHYLIENSLPLSIRIFPFVNKSLRSWEKALLIKNATNMVMPALIAALEAYLLSLWYDFVVDSPLAVPRVLQLTLQYMTLSYVQIFQLIFVKSF